MKSFVRWLTTYSSYCRSERTLERSGAAGLTTSLSRS